MASDVRLSDGSFDFSLGVDSGRVPTVESNLTPNGLKRSQVSWLENGTCRGGAIAPRAAWKKLCTVVPPSSNPNQNLFQGGWMYDAGTQDASKHPYLMLSIGGHIFQVRVDTNNVVTDLSVAFGLINPASVPQAFFVQGEEFMVEQIGDYSTRPLFWDGATLRRSIGP